MRVALKIAYDGRSFHGHQRQPKVRTVEGECIAAARQAKILQDPREAFFRSASRTDRGVSAVGNVIAFNTTLRADGVVGAFNDRARDVWAWAFALVPDDFHPRRADERWYRYHLVADLSLDRLAAAGALFEGEHDSRLFTPCRFEGKMRVRRVTVSAHEGICLVDIRGPAFRRGMVRRIVSAMVSHATGEASLDDIERALRAEGEGFGMLPAEPLTLMDVSYGLSFRTVAAPKAFAEWAAKESDLRLRLQFHRELRDAMA